MVAEDLVASIPGVVVDVQGILLLSKILLAVQTKFMYQQTHGENVVIQKLANAVKLLMIRKDILL